MSVAALPYGDGPGAWLDLSQLGDLGDCCGKLTVALHHVLRAEHVDQSPRAAFILKAFY